jgi:hypothetical protein
MLESTVELLVSLFLIALTLLIGSCIVGSIIAALRAVSHGSARVNTSGLVQPEMGECAPLVNITLMGKIIVAAPRTSVSTSGYPSLGLAAKDILDGMQNAGTR